MLSCEPNRSGVVQKAFVDELCAYMPDMAIVIIPNAVHEIHHDQPEACMQVVLDFIKSEQIRYNFDYTTEKPFLCKESQTCNSRPYA